MLQYQSWTIYLPKGIQIYPASHSLGMGLVWYDIVKTLFNKLFALLQEVTTEDICCVLQTHSYFSIKFGILYVK